MIDADAVRPNRYSSTIETMLRRPAQEIEIDHLLAEEFACDPGFAGRFLEACGLSPLEFRVTTTVAEPSLGGEGFGDLLVEGMTSDGRRVALLIEDKITAAPATRQADRYASFALQLCRTGYHEAWPILVAPAAYRGERERYAASINLETVAAIIRATDPSRLAYRRGVIERALAKKANTGVKIPDLALHSLKAAYLRYASEWCAREGLQLDFPALRESYYDRDSWIENIGHSIFRPGVKLRHRLWTNLSDRVGSVDLIVKRTSADKREAIARISPEGARAETFSRGLGTQVSFPIAEMDQRTNFDEGIALQALERMRELISWYQKNLIILSGE